MKITKLETFHIRPRWLFLKVHTDTDIVGWGEPLLEGRALTVEAAVHEIGRTLVGQDPTHIERIWQRYYRGTFYRGGPVLMSALSGIEQALWDILGKSLGVPIHRLLGGRVRDKIRLYGWLNISETGDYVSQVAREVEAKEFTAYKFVPVPASESLESPCFLDKVVSTVAGLRRTLGDDIDMALDFHGRCNPAVARQLCRELEPYRPFFIEEPALPTNPKALVTIKESTTIPIAAGERLYSRWDFNDLLNLQAVSIIQPDLSHVGGIFEARKIAAMAEIHDVPIAPHCPLGPIALAACLQLDACTPNFLCQEHLTLGEGYLKEPFQTERGYVFISDQPGLGIELDESKLEGYIFDGTWETPQFTHADGSFAEW
ncbi:MAG: galactonate dehydratase [Verrucomicrobia bacterium 61-8]|nr:galactonate dehydratase [Verrucomicrobiota bacterium]OJV25373.1 MAG: galactonate dehydratase [Verrucomicrobia bacterium 61-8]